MIQQFISKLSEKEKKLLYITVAIVTLTLLDRLFLGPVWDKLKNIDEEIANQEVSVKRDMRFLMYKDKILQENKVFEKYFNVKKQEEDEINTAFFSAIEQMANRSNVTLIKSNPSETKKEKDSSQHYANVDCTGKLNDIITFMHIINSTDDLFKIIKFDMTSKRGTADEVNASITIVKLIMNSAVR